jgi:hypothetical protein
VGESTNRTSLVAGVFFILAGSMFLLDRLGLVELRLRVLTPALLIAIGVAVLLGGRKDRSSP